MSAAKSCPSYIHCSDISIGFLTCVCLRRTLCARSSGVRRTVTSSHPATDMFIVGGLYALAFLERGGLWRHRIRNWYVYRVSRDIERIFSLNNDPAISTTRGDTCIDAVFRRHVEYLQTMNFVSYFQLSQTVAQYSSTTTAFCNLWWHSYTVIFVGNNNKIH